MPALPTRASASASASIAAVSMKLPASFTRLASEGCRPSTKVRCPIASSSGRARSMASSGPAATMKSFAAAAASGRPNTGAERSTCPASACTFASRSTVSGASVLIETCRPWRGSPSRMPSLPVVAASTALSSASMEMTTPARAASAGVAATVAPSARSASARLAVRFQTHTS